MRKDFSIFYLITGFPIVKQNSYEKMLENFYTNHFKNRVDHSQFHSLEILFHTIPFFA